MLFSLPEHFKSLILASVAKNIFYFTSWQVNNQPTVFQTLSSMGCYISTTEC